MATSIASVTTDTTNYTRIHLILMKGGTLLTKTLFLKRVKDLSPAGHELTVDEFLGKHRVQILSTSTGRNNEEKLYPLTGTTNLDEWDLPLYCFILKTVCGLLWINKMDMKFLKTMRNELSHLHDPSLTDEDFKSRLSMIEPIFTRSLQVINDPLFEGEITNLVQRYKTGALAVDEIVKIHHDSSRKNIELLSNQLKIMKNQVDILQNQNIHNTQLTTALSMLKKIDDKLPSGSDVDIPDVCVIIEVKNCTRDKEQELLDFLVKQFNETISKPEFTLTKDFPNLAMHTISEAICTTLKEFLAKGRHVLKVEKKCISLTIKCNSLSSFVSLVSDCIDGSLLHQLKSLKDAVRRWDGCAGADLDPTISADGISSAIIKIATNLDEKLLGEDQSAVLLLPEVCSSTMSVDSPSSLETFPLCSTGSILRLTIKPDTIECRKEIEESFVGSVTEGLEQFQNELRKDPDFQNLVIEAKILASDNGRTGLMKTQQFETSISFENPHNTQGSDTKRMPPIVSLPEPHTLYETDDLTESSSLYFKEERVFDKPRRSFQNKESKASTMAASSSSYLLVVAFDFGTTYSGYAFSFRNDPLKVYTNQNWIAGSERLISLKTPTCVLLDPDKNFHSFGFEAENKFSDLADQNKHWNWLLFRNFKMMLHNNQKLSRNTMVEDINGNKMEAMRIFAMSIRYLKDHALTTLERQTIKLKEEDILYVLTIPAIWDDPAKQFMREAAIEAGIDTIRLRLALEPEAASIWCQVMTEESKTVLAGSGSRYMVVDLGGGTADITVHEKQPDSTLKELHKASGGPWGGIYVDENYILWLEKIFGKNVIDRFKKEEIIDYFSLLRDFEIKKRIISSELKEPIYLRLPPSLMEKMNEESDSVLPLDERLRLLNTSHDVTIRRDRMRLDPDIVRLWFENPVNKLIDHIKRILNEPQMKMVNLILLVGGFGESQYVRDKFKAHLSDKDIIVPAEAGLVVLKGAVRFGHEPTVVSARVMQLSYGIEGWDAFDETRHPASKMTEFKDRKYAKNLFGKFVSVGDIVPVGHEVTKKGFPRNLSKTTLPVFCSTDANPMFTTEPSCKKLGELIIEYEDSGTQEDKKHEFTLVFGETELIVKAKILKTGREFKTTIDCLK